MKNVLYVIAAVAMFPLIYCAMTWVTMGYAWARTGLLICLCFQMPWLILTTKNE